MRKRAALCLFAALGLGPGSAPAARFVDVGHGGSEAYKLALDSIEADGPRLLRFWTRSYSGGYYARHRMTLVAVDCQARTRAELATLSIDRSSSHEGPAPSTEMRRVYEKTRQAEELDAACHFAATEQVPEDVREVEPPKAPATTPAGPGRAVAAGIVASRDGLVVTAFEAVKGCQALSVWHGGTLRAATLLNDEPMSHLAVLKIEGYLPEVLLPARQPGLEAASTLAGFDSGTRPGDPPRRLALKPARATDAGPAGLPRRLALPLPVSSGWLLDGEQAVHGLVIFDMRDQPLAPLVEWVSPITVNHVLWYHGHGWLPPDSAPKPSDNARAAQTALVRVACHDP